MTDSHDLITEKVVNTAERIEGMESGDELNRLDVEVTATLNGDVKEIVLVLTVGGPYIEYNVTNGTVFGSWGGETHRTHVNNDALGNALHDRYARQFCQTR